MRLTLNPSPLFGMTSFMSFSLGGFPIQSGTTITTTTTAFGARPV